jgi:hypothetical protein
MFIRHPEVREVLRKLCQEVVFVLASVVKFLRNLLVVPLVAELVVLLGRSIWPRTGLFRFCAMTVVPAQVFAGRRPTKTGVGTTGIAQHLKNPLMGQLVRYRRTK